MEKREPPRREITKGFVDWLKDIGASEDLVNFAEQHRSDRPKEWDEEVILGVAIVILIIGMIVIAVWGLGLLK